MKFRFQHILVFAITSVSAMTSCDEIKLESVQNTAKNNEVLVSIRKITSGEELSTENCRIATWPVQFSPEGFLSNFNEIQGRVALGPIPANAIIARNLTGLAIAPMRLAQSKKESHIANKE